MFMITAGKPGEPQTYFGPFPTKGAATQWAHLRLELDDGETWTIDVLESPA